MTTSPLHRLTLALMAGLTALGAAEAQARPARGRAPVPVLLDGPVTPEACARLGYAPPQDREDYRGRRPPMVGMAAPPPPPSPLSISPLPAPSVAQRAQESKAAPAGAMAYGPSP